MRAPETGPSRRFHRSPGTSRNDWDRKGLYQGIIEGRHIRNLVVRSNPFLDQSERDRIGIHDQSPKQKVTF
jgi:hypothetical protein